MYLLIRPTILVRPWSCTFFLRNVCFDFKFTFFCLFGKNIKHVSGMLKLRAVNVRKSAQTRAQTDFGVKRNGEKNMLTYRPCFFVRCQRKQGIVLCLMNKYDIYKLTFLVIRRKSSFFVSKDGESKGLHAIVQQQTHIIRCFCHFVSGRHDSMSKPHVHMTLDSTGRNSLYS